MIKSFVDLEVWKLSKAFAKDIYVVTDSFHEKEKFGLSQQLRRAAISVMSNIAEGSGRRSNQEFMRFINIASGSLCETESQLMLAADLGYIKQSNIDLLLEKADRISKMLYALHRSLAHKAT